MLTGSIVALVTPMHENGEVAWDALDELIEWQVASGRWQVENAKYEVVNGKWKAASSH